MNLTSIILPFGRACFALRGEKYWTKIYMGDEGLCPMVQPLSQTRTKHMHYKQIEAVHDVITFTSYGVRKGCKIKSN